MAAQLPGFSTTPAVAVAIGAATVAMLRMPLAAVILATLLTSKAGPGASPLVIVGVVVAYLTTQLLSGPEAPETPGEDEAKAPQEAARAVAPGT